jgi:hypothetical protein
MTSRTPYYSFPYLTNADEVALGKAKGVEKDSALAKSKNDNRCHQSMRDREMSLRDMFRPFAWTEVEPPKRFHDRRNTSRRKGVRCIVEC